MSHNPHFLYSQNEDSNVADEGVLLRERFLRWQCRVRQIIMRKHQGRPDESIMADAFLPDQKEPVGCIITLLLKSPDYAQTMEFRHIALKTHDPAQRMENAIKFLSSSYYQNAHQFSDCLFASFSSSSSLGGALLQKKSCRLKFQAYQQGFSVACHVTKLNPQDYFFQAAWWHNTLFNPALSRDVTFLCLTPDWDNSQELSLTNSLSHSERDSSSLKKRDG